MISKINYWALDKITKAKAKSQEEGQGLAEYALILALVAVVAAAALLTLEDQITATLTEVGNAM